MRRIVLLLSSIAVALVAVALVADTGPDAGQSPPIGNTAQGRANGSSTWDNLGLGALVGALVGAMGTHMLRERAEAKREARELRGLLRLIASEINTNDQTMALLLKNRMAGDKAEKKFEDTAWQHANVRLAQLLEDERHFQHLDLYYRNNANFGAFAFSVAEARLDIAADLAIKCATHSGSNVGRKIRGSAYPRPIPMGFRAFHKLHFPPSQIRLCVAEFMTRFVCGVPGA